MINWRVNKNEEKTNRNNSGLTGRRTGGWTVHQNMNDERKKPCGQASRHESLTGGYRRFHTLHVHGMCTLGYIHRGGGYTHMSLKLDTKHRRPISNSARGGQVTRANTRSTAGKRRRFVHRNDKRKVHREENNVVRVCFSLQSCESPVARATFVRQKYFSLSSYHR